MFEKIDEYRWRIPKSYKNGMRVDGVIYADEKMIGDILSDKAPEQVANVAFLPNSQVFAGDCRIYTGVTVSL